MTSAPPGQPSGPVSSAPVPSPPSGTGQPTPPTRHVYVPAIIGALATLGAAVIGLFAAQSAGVVTVVAGAQPTVTVTPPAVTVTTTMPAPVTSGIDGAGVTADQTVGSTGNGVVHLADTQSRPEDVVVAGSNFNVATNVGINGKTYDFALERDVAPGYQARIESVNLARRYSTFTARVGLRDTSRDNSVKVDVVLDGVVVKTGIVSLGRSYDWSVDVRNGLRLEIRAFAPRTGSATVAVGDPTITP